jgi:hypothetical protein
MFFKPRQKPEEMTEAGLAARGETLGRRKEWVSRNVPRFAFGLWAATVLVAAACLTGGAALPLVMIYAGPAIMTGAVSLAVGGIVKSECDSETQALSEENKERAHQRKLEEMKKAAQAAVAAAETRKNPAGLQQEFDAALTVEKGTQRSIAVPGPLKFRRNGSGVQA